MTRKIFISYSGNRDERQALWTALREHGLRPWRDVEDLDLGAQSQRSIPGEIAECAAAILWLSEEAFTSDFVANIEVPAIREAIRERGINLLPVFDGLTPAEAESRAVANWGLSISNHNGHLLNRGNGVEGEAATISERLTRTRMRTLAAAGERPVIRCVTRDDVADHRDVATLNFDWRHAYSNGQIPNPAETERLSHALGSSLTHLKDSFPPGPIDLAIKAHLHLGVALGHALRRPTGFIPRMTKEGEVWEAHVLDTGDVPMLRKRTEPGPPTASRVSMEVSLTRDVSQGVNERVARAGNAYRERVFLSPPGGPSQTSLTDSDTANLWARQTAEEMAQLLILPDVQNTDLYIAGPIEYAVLLGWWLNAAGNVTIFHWAGNAGPYQPIWRLPTV